MRRQSAAATGALDRRVDGHNASLNVFGARSTGTNVARPFKAGKLTK
jgi:hypothetical protein